MARHQPSAVGGLEINQVKDGLIVYQPERDRVHYLNATAAVVFTFADGTLDAAAIADLVGRAYGLEETPQADVEAYLAQLLAEGLVE